MNNFGFNTRHLYTSESKADAVTFKRILNTVMFIVLFINMIFTSFLKNIKFNTTNFMHRVAIIIVTENPPSWKITFLAGFVFNTIGYSRLPLRHTCLNSLITNLWKNILMVCT